jgi:N-acetylmuramoyl-L-alanine amidase
MLRVNGFKVVLTRDSDTSLHDDDHVSNRKKKNSDIMKRFAIANPTITQFF